MIETQNGVVRDGVCNIRWIDNALRVHGQDRDRNASAFHCAARIEHGVVFGCLSDDVRSLRRGRHAFDGEGYRIPWPRW